MSVQNHGSEPTRRRALAEALGSHPTILGVDDVSDGPTDVVLEATTVAGLERVPPAVLREIASMDFGVSSVKPKNGHWIVEVR